MELNKRDLEITLKQQLIDESYNNNYLKENVSRDERKIFREWIKSLTYKQTISLFFESNLNISDKKVMVYEDELDDSLSKKLTDYDKAEKVRDQYKREIEAIGKFEEDRLKREADITARFKKDREEIEKVRDQYKREIEAIGKFEEDRLKREADITARFKKDREEIEKAVKQNDAEWDDQVNAKTAQNRQDLKNASKKIAKGVAITIAVAAILYAAYRIYKAYFTKAAQYCKGKKGYDKDQCMEKFKKDAIQAQINNLRNGINQCNKSSKPQLCRQKIQDKINRLQKKLWN